MGCKKIDIFFPSGIINIPSVNKFTCYIFNPVIPECRIVEYLNIGCRCSHFLVKSADFMIFINSKLYFLFFVFFVFLDFEATPRPCSGFLYYRLPVQLQKIDAPFTLFF